MARPKPTPMTKKQIRAALAKHFKHERRMGYAPPINAGGKRPWSWAPILAALLACAPVATNTSAPPEPVQCCRYCTNSQACGDGCIPYESTCHKPKGCACEVHVHT